MKNLMFLILIAIGSAFAAPTYYNSTNNKSVESVPGEAFSILLFDALLQPADTAYSRPIDLLKLPITYRDTGIGDAALLPDLGAGTGMLSCHDASDSAAVTDSVDVTAQLYVSQYAGDNSNPNGTGESGGKSDAWATLGSAYSLDAASDTQTLVEGTAAITLTSNLDRFVRLRIINDNATIKDRSRCRFFWVKKAVKR